MQEFSLNNFLTYYAPQLMTWQGMTGVGLFLLAAFMLIMVDRTKWVILTLLLWMGTFGISSKAEGRGLIPIFENLRPISRFVDIALLALLLIPMVKSSRGRRSRLLGGGALALLLFQFVMSVRHFYDLGADRGILGLVTFMLIFMVLAFGVSRWLQHPADEFALLYCVVASAIMLSLGTIVQLVANYSAALSGRQLAGTTENPNSFGSHIAIALPVACYVMASSRASKFWRVTGGLFVAAGTVFLLWSGSRSSVLGAAVAILILFRTRLRLWVGAILVGGLVLVVVMWGFGIDITGLEHLSSTSNSRTMIWGVMCDQFMSSPMFGVGGEGLHENSYLGTAAGFGLVGLVPLVITLLLICRDAFRASRTIRLTHGDRLFSNLLWGWLVGALVASIFEAHLVGTFTYFIYTFYLMLTLMTAAADPRVAESSTIQQDENGADIDPLPADAATSFGAQYF